MKITVRALDWADGASYPSESFDVLIGCDLIYDVALVDVLSRAVAKLLSREGRMYYVYDKQR